MQRKHRKHKMQKFRKRKKCIGCENCINLKYCYEREKGKECNLQRMPIMQRMQKMQ